MKQIKIQNICKKVQPLWNEFLTDTEKEIENLSLFKSKVKSNLLSYENKVIFF